MRERRDGDGGEQQKRRIGLHSLLRPSTMCQCCIQKEVIVGGLDTLRSCDISPLQTSVFYANNRIGQ